MSENLTVEQIEWVRRQMGWTHDKMATQLDYSTQHLKNIAGGHRAIPADFKERLHKAVSKEINLKTKQYSNLKALLDCQEEKVNNR